MSHWTQIRGTIIVEPKGRTDAENRYILETVLNHLPIVSGSEFDMVPYVNKVYGCNSFCSHDEYGNATNLAMYYYDDGHKMFNRHKFHGMQREYILTFYTSLRARYVSETYKEFMKWLVRLSKRIHVLDVDIDITGTDKDWNPENITIKSTKFDELYERYDGEDPTTINWTDHLRWDSCFKNFTYPAQLEYKYYGADKNDKS